MINAIYDLDNWLQYHSLLNPTTDDHYFKLDENFDPKNINRFDKFNWTQSKVIKITECIFDDIQDRFHMVLGPPGTGKSRTIANVVLNILPKLQKKKLLLCAPSNKACDELLRRIVDRFSEENIPCEPGTVIRVGCQASDEYKLSDYYLDHLVLQELVRQLKSKPDLLNSEAQKIEKKIVEKAKIVISTLNYCASTRLRHLVHKLALIIVDEASQGLEPDLLIPLRFRCHKLILVGDPNQLSPTVLSDAGRAYNLQQSLYSRIYSIFRNYKDKSSTITMLITQYRMHLEICRFPNQCFYGGRLITHSSVAQRMAHFPLRPYSVYDLIHGRHEMDEGTRSSYNMLEVACIQRFCTMLVTNVNIWQSLIGQNSAMESTQSNSTTTIQLNDDFSIAIQRRIAVITPYSAQVALLQKYLPPAIDVMTADSSQGSEKDIIIISCVRGNDSIGFLDDKSRLNVMLTRAKYGLYIFGNLTWLSNQDENWRDLSINAHNRGILYTIGGSMNIKSLPQH
ncbi:unnamed protein product [Rotaria sp. Silwood1]|nr:unnamed protein product [Rotaria sp. Silwood1]